MAVETDAAGLAEDLLRAVRAGNPTDDYWTEIADLAGADLLALSPDARKAFWLNVYNAAVQSHLADDRAVYENRRRFFGERWIPVAGTRLSLDDVEHGILRRSHPKWGLGYVRNPFPGEFERRHRLPERDSRIHFALNCGAESCPPIAAYEANSVDTQLDVATDSYFGQSVEFDPVRNVAVVPRVFLWFRGDFGGRSGILDLLQSHDAVPRYARPRFRYREYDWSLDLGNYR